MKPATSIVVRLCAGFNGQSTYAHDYLVESMPAETLWLVVRNGGSSGFASLASGRMLALGDSPSGHPSLSHRTISNWGANESWERQRGGSSSATNLVAAKKKDQRLGWTPLLMSCLPTAELTRAEAFWQAQAFAATEKLKQQVQLAQEAEQHSAELLNATQRQAAIASQRMAELEGRLQLLEREGGEAASVGSGGPDSERGGAEPPQQQQQQEEEARSAEVAELQAKLAAAEEAVRRLSADREAAVAAAQVDMHAQLQAKEEECRCLLQDRHRLDVALFTVKNMVQAAKFCSPSSSADSGGASGVGAPGGVPAAGAAQLGGELIPAALPSSKALARDPSSAEWLVQQSASLQSQASLQHLVDVDELMISFRPGTAAQRPVAAAGSEPDGESLTVEVGAGTWLVNYGGSHPSRMDEAALNRILDQPMQQPEEQEQPRRTFKSLDSAPTSPTAVEASPASHSDGGWAAGSLSLPDSCVKALEPSNRCPQDRLRASAAVRDMGLGSPKAADALAELFADQLVMCASLQQLPPAKKSAQAVLRHSAPAKPSGKPRSSFLLRSALPDVFDI